MRASPSFQLCIRHFGVWRAMLFALQAGVVSALGMWALSSGNPLPWPWRTCVLVISAGLVGAGAISARRVPLSLRWDTQTWHLGPAATAGEEPWQGRLAVAFDMGVWMLLRFDAQSGAHASRAAWVPVQRLGLEAQWHGLRCAVYCARPAEAHAGAAALRSDQNDNNERP